MLITTKRVVGALFLICVIALFVTLGTPAHSDWLTRAFIAAVWFRWESEQ